MFYCRAVTALPLIPEFTLLSRIGGGSYGEVFLARSVTGSHRAVKIVSRQDFERDRTFEREFEGIQKFEKVSQDHPGLIDVLHAGRNDAEGFYYYVMELADDEVSGRIIDPEHYSPRTLASDLKHRRALTVRDCARVGAMLAEALGHLHDAGLTHRDVKPSNIIFVRGEPKLADIGLVASTGQRTYVGTEGYVPPEGPGTPSADLYGLSMVLYEMLTGKDRLEFPELPTNLQIPPTVNRDEWRAMNTAICRGGSPDPKKRFASGREMAAALRHAVGEATLAGKRPRGRSGLGWAVTFALAGAGAYAGYGEWAKHRHSDLGTTPPLAGVPPTTTDPVQELGPLPPEPVKELAREAVKTLGPTETPANPPVSPNPLVPPIPAPEIPPTPSPAAPPEMARLKIVTAPPGALVIQDGKEIMPTPTRYLSFPPGKVVLEVRLEGYHTAKLEMDLKPGIETTHIDLRPDRRPVEGQPWTNSLGLNFNSEAGLHITSTEIGGEEFRQFLDATGIPLAMVVHQGVALVDDPAMWAFCDWLTERDRQEGFLDENHYLAPQRSVTEGLEKSFFCRIEDRFGSLAVNSEPSGAEVRSSPDGAVIGRTPLLLDHHRSGPVSLSLRLPGFQEHPLTPIVSPSTVSPVVVHLDRDASLVFGEPWENALGMKFVTVGSFMASIWETRVSDFAAYAAAVGIPPPEGDAGPDHPMAGVNVTEARAFCDWLTKRDQEAGLLAPTQSYHLPTDLEWSEMAGLTGETGTSPESREVRSGAGPELFPWQGGWPPPKGAGNFADVSARKMVKYIIPGYDDGAMKTAPVGSYEPNALGLYDLAGNVWEWVDDPYGTSGALQAVRGGAWNVGEKDNLRTSYRNAVKPQIHEGIYGFRCVIRQKVGD